VQLCEKRCDPCVCVLGMLCVFRVVDRWGLAILAWLQTRKDLADSASLRPPSALVEEKKEENKFSVLLGLAFIDFSKSSKSTRCLISECWLCSVVMM
jgi:hypothetical protein